MSDTAAVLKTCSQIEGKVAEIYHLLSDLHRENAELSALWRKTALEEENHMYQFQLAARISREMVAGTRIDGRKAQAALNMVESVQGRLREKAPTFAGGLRFAIELEEKLSAFHMENAVIFENDQAESLFHAMMASDRDHVAALQRFLERIDSKAPAGGMTGRP